MTARLLKKISSEEAAAMEADTEAWEQSVSGTATLCRLRGRLETVRTARAYRMQFGKASDEVQAALAIAVRRDDIDSAYGIPSAKWWIENGSRSMDYIIAAARAYMEGIRGETKNSTTDNKDTNAN
jgi:hypothetical protein